MVCKGGGWENITNWGFSGGFRSSLGRKKDIDYFEILGIIRLVRNLEYEKTLRVHMYVLIYIEVRKIRRNTVELSVGFLGSSRLPSVKKEGLYPYVQILYFVNMFVDIKQDIGRHTYNIYIYITQTYMSLLCIHIFMYTNTCVKLVCLTSILLVKLQKRLTS